MTRRINMKSPSHFGFDRQCRILKSWQKHTFLHLGEGKIVSVAGKLFILCGGAHLACFRAENRDLPGF